MYEELDPEAEKDKENHRSVPGTRSQRTPRATRSTRHVKKPPSAFGGSHRRRNKHWSW